MLASAIPDTVMGTNCWVLATGRGQECIVVDPGFDVLDRLRAELLEHRLRPAAVVLTHGHADHVWSVTPVCRSGAAGSGGVPALVHGDDRYRLRDPLADLSAPLRAMLEQQFGPAARWEEPDDVRDLVADQVLEIAGLSLRVQHAPGHTEGSTVLSLDEAPDVLSGALAGAERVVMTTTSTVLAGDVLFAGSIGRCDLPGGDPAAMARSLRDVVLPMPDDRLVLPGHGPVTTIGRERAVNPFLPR
ncbi:Glyoxylase, beta-lactamase superfamily II [Quadrisphaera granulorum]|uniref:Glyoxylase-like metal-dependent hydrolase (Beta-lactamase superfamily II) n=1 Tax=Quadrisphaera granulorum TaxID=317664 RepID=A0A316A7G4_9ACTN|nr:MBL fold metallo-hydrolase [Quadrisphaera granulorum]PWJ53543.1 glyoxylase-like metal-dependent hydrolase (beta-lactamase superfamily II) [Quadrisphaera granulorum]SZE96885.1 Glyoxylase, beta-lactamase superfamily II [Quadrisphaera granulorum]